MFPDRTGSNEPSLVSGDLVPLLSQADAALGHLRDRAEKIMALEDAVSLGFCPRQMKTLCAILDYGRGRIHRRLAIMSGTVVAEGESPSSNPPFGVASPVAFMAEYRACCRLLCSALRESRRISSSPTVAMLSDLVLRLEKQLWVMDSPKHDPGSEPYRTVSLFLTC